MNRGPWGVTQAERAAIRIQNDVEKASKPLPEARELKPLPTNRICRICSQEKPISDFVRTSATAWNWRCQSCRAEQRRHSPSGDPDVRYDRHLRRTYGFTLQRYNELLTAQNGLCAICRQPERIVGGRHGSTPLRLSLDHDHETKSVRGLLCSACNQGIEFFRHDNTLLQAAIAYLQNTAREESVMIHAGANVMGMSPE